MRKEVKGGEGVEGRKAGKEEVICSKVQNVLVSI